MILKSTDNDIITYYYKYYNYICYIIIMTSDYITVIITVIKGIITQSITQICMYIVYFKYISINVTYTSTVQSFSSYCYFSDFWFKMNWEFYKRIKILLDKESGRVQQHWRHHWFVSGPVWEVQRWIVQIHWISLFKPTWIDSAEISFTYWEWRSGKTKIKTTHK